MSAAETTAAPVAVFERVARWYGQVCGVVDVGLSLPPGVTGLLGPNGAGKSTMLRLLVGLLRPSQGRVRVFGRDPAADAETFRRLGYCSEDDALFDDLTPREFLRLLARLHGFTGPERGRRTERAIERLGLGPAADRACGGLSKGTRQRVRIAAAILHEPDLLVMDEPMTGLDPLARRDVLDLVETWARAGRSVLFSSHILHEVEAAARHVVVIHRGMVLAEGTPAHLQEALSDGAFTLEIVCRRPRELARLLLAAEHVSGVSFPAEGRLRAESRSGRALVSELPEILLAAGMADEVEEILAPDENLESLFRRLVK
jgi:ABC-2 type transport system ATP-binding protein